MRTVFNICFLVCYLFINIQAQQWLQIKPTFNSSKKLITFHGFFSDENNGWWLTLFPGTILHTTNKGISWETQVESCNAGIGGIVFIDSLHGWLQGQTLPNPEYEYFILNTKDGGKSWNRYFAPVLTCLTFFDSLVGFAGGDNIYKTTDGGVTWKTMTIESHVGSVGITDIFFIDRKYGWAVGGGWIFDNGIILNTVDGGATWQYNDPETTVGNAIVFTDSLHGYIAGSNPPFFEGMIKVTNDGGKNWLTHYLPGTWLRDIVFTDDSSGWAVGDYGFIWQTTDQGKNWNQVESGTTSHLYRLFFFDNGNKGYIFGADSTLLKYDKTVGVKEEKPVLLTSFKVFQNYPNPFNPTTQIQYALPNTSNVIVTVYNSLGQTVKVFNEGTKEAGNHNITFNGEGLSSGIYIYSVHSVSIDGKQNFTATKKMLLLR